MQRGQIHQAFYYLFTSPPAGHSIFAAGRAGPAPTTAKNFFDRRRQIKWQCLKVKDCG